MGLVEYTAQFFAPPTAGKGIQKNYTNHIIIGYLSNGLLSMVADHLL